MQYHGQGQGQGQGQGHGTYGPPRGYPPPQMQQGQGQGQGPPGSGSMSMHPPQQQHQQHHHQQQPRHYQQQPPQQMQMHGQGQGQGQGQGHGYASSQQQQYYSQGPGQGQGIGYGHAPSSSSSYSQSPQHNLYPPPQQPPQYSIGGGGVVVGGGAPPPQYQHHQPQYQHQQQQHPPPQSQQYNQYQPPHPPQPPRQALPLPHMYSSGGAGAGTGAGIGQNQTAPSSGGSGSGSGSGKYQPSSPLQSHGQGQGQGQSPFSPNTKGGALPIPVSAAAGGGGYASGQGMTTKAPVMPPPPSSMGMGMSYGGGAGAGTGAPPMSSSTSGAAAGVGGGRLYPVSDTIPIISTPSSYGGSPSASASGRGGRGFGNGSTRIDPSQMPRPTTSANIYYDTRQSSKRSPPSAGSSFVVQDSGNCSPRHMRVTMCQPPATADLAKECAIPFALVTSPFAPVEGPEEAEVPVVYSVDSNPPRCTRCRGYINSAVGWLENGSTWQCNLCSMQNSVPDWYYCSLDGSGLRMDRGSRSELHSGSVDFVVGDVYRSQPVVDPAYVFAIDISPRAVACGATMASIQAVDACIRELRSAFEEVGALYVTSEEKSTSATAPATATATATDSTGASANVGNNAGDPAEEVHANNSSAPLADIAMKARVGIFTFHRSIQYYSICKDHNEKVKMHMVDSWDPIAALPPSLWLKSIAEQWDEIQLLLQRLPELIATEQGIDKESGYNTAGGYSGGSSIGGELKGACTGAAMKSAQMALAKTQAGGRVFILSPNSPSIGCPKVAKRENGTSYCSPNEVALYGIPEAQPFLGKVNAEIYKDVADFITLGQDCASTGVCIDVLLMLDGEEYRDTALLGHVCDASGGNLIMLRGDLSEADNAFRLEKQLNHCVRRAAGSNAICKVRTSTGFKIDKYYSKGVSRNYDGELDLAGVDEDTTFVAGLTHDGKLNEDDCMYIQLAVLYTDNRKRRMVRVHNLCLRATENHTAIFRGADLDAVVYTMVAQTVEKALIQPISEDNGPRDFIKTTIADTLYSYRVHCSSHSPRGQLILPDSLKLLPLFCLGMLKHPAFIDNVDLRGKTSLIRGHERAYELRRLRSCPVGTLVHSICPRLFELMRLNADTFNSSLEGKVQTSGKETGSSSGGKVYGGGESKFHPSSSWRMQLAKARTVTALAPRTATISAEALDSSSVYLLDDGSCLYLHIGRACTRVELEEWFSVAPHSRPDSVTFNTEVSDTARYMASLIESLQIISTNKPELVIIWGDEPVTSAATRFSMRLVEDSLYGNMSYTDFLCKIHASITTRLAK